jgi:hypothetical protein
MKNKNAAKKVTSGIIAIFVLAICLFATTIALVWEAVSVKDNLFITGRVKLNLNDGKPVIQENEYLFEPGMRVAKDFFLENLSGCPVYYRLYFSDIGGGLADELEITVLNGDTVLYSGKITELTKDKVAAADDAIEAGERREFSILFHYPKESGNPPAEKHVTFTLCAEGVQTINNPDKLF